MCSDINVSFCGHIFPRFRFRFFAFHIQRCLLAFGLCCDDDDDDTRACECDSHTSHGGDGKCLPDGLGSLHSRTNTRLAFGSAARLICVAVLLLK